MSNSIVWHEWLRNLGENYLSAVVIGNAWMDWQAEDSEKALMMSECRKAIKNVETLEIVY